MRWFDIVFLEVEDVEEMHDDAIARHGGSVAILDRRLLESAVAAPRQGYCSTLAEIAATYANGIAKNHAFEDGNKRTALYAMLSFLDLNGFAVVVGAEWVEIMVDLVVGKISRDELADRIATDLLGGGPVPIDDT